MKKFLKIILFVILIVIMFGVAGIFYLSRGLDAGSQLVINEVNLTRLSDGTYTGRYEAGRWANEMAVVIKDHTIAAIEVVKDVTFSKPDIRDDLLAKVIRSQSTQVDVIAGSTVTCKAYLKAIEIALTK